MLDIKLTIIGWGQVPRGIDSKRTVEGGGVGGEIVFSKAA